jgi:hypothetical protein
MENRDIRAALDRHWAASDANDFEAEHEFYQEDAVLEYPQSGERIRGRHNIQASRFAQPNKRADFVAKVPEKRPDQGNSAIIEIRMTGSVDQNSRFDLGARKLFFVPAPKIVLQQYRPDADS